MQWKKRQKCGLYNSIFLSNPQEKEAVEGVSVGAILSDYQRVRVENV